jgi:hypothetical protein
MKKYILILCTSIFFWLSWTFSQVFAHVLIPPQFKKYVIEHPHATVPEVQKMIDDRWTMSDIEWLSGMTSTELAARLLVSYGSGDSSLLSWYTPTSSEWVWNIDSQTKTLVTTLLYYITLGIKHILSGRDHIMYVLSLLILITSWKRLVGWLSLFTIAHSCTLALMVLWLVAFPSLIAEIIIALSIVCSSVWFLWKWKSASSNIFILYITIFWFGLFHGLWFANVFTELNIASSQILLPLIWFNIGVEIWQLIVVLWWYIFLSLSCRNKKSHCLLQQVIASIIWLFGVIWVMQRIIALLREFWFI